MMLSTKGKQKLEHCIYYTTGVAFAIDIGHIGVNWSTAVCIIVTIVE